MIAAHLRHAREAAGLTQAELAERIGRERKTIIALEAGTPSTLRTLEDALHVCGEDEIGERAAIVAFIRSEAADCRRTANARRESDPGGALEIDRSAMTMETLALQIERREDQGS